MKVTIVDYNSGNISSVINSFEEVAKNKVNIEVTSDLGKIKSSDKLVLPGQGSFKSCVDALNKIDGLKVDGTKIKNSFEQTEFNKLQKMEIKYGFEDKANKGFFFRKGKIGSWKDEVPDEIIKKIEKIFYQEMVELKYLLLI